MQIPIIITNSRFVKWIGYAGFSFGIWIMFAPVANITPRLIRHETIHYRQQLEMLFVFHWLWYGIEYLVRLIIYGNHEAAYRNLSFEREAYMNDGDAAYLTNRRLYSWVKYIH